MNETLKEQIDFLIDTNAGNGTWKQDKKAMVNDIYGLFEQALKQIAHDNEILVNTLLETKIKEIKEHEEKVLRKFANWTMHTSGSMRSLVEQFIKEVK